MGKTGGSPPQQESSADELERVLKAQAEDQDKALQELLATMTTLVSAAVVPGLDQGSATETVKNLIVPLCLGAALTVLFAPD